MAKIKFALRHNLIYPLQYIIWSFSRNILSIVIKHVFDFGDSLFYISIMYLGELIGGVIFYLYQKKFISQKKEAKDKYFMSIKLISNEETDEDYFIPLDNNTKILFLIFMSSYFDGFQFFLWDNIIPKYVGLSPSLNLRLTGIAIISSSSR